MKLHRILRSDRFWGRAFVVVFACALVALLVAGQIEAQPKPQPRPQWAIKDCFTLDDVTRFLNALPADRAADAKVLAINSQRSFVGVLSTPYYVWYRK